MLPAFSPPSSHCHSLESALMVLLINNALLVGKVHNFRYCHFSLENKHIGSSKGSVLPAIFLQHFANCISSYKRGKNCFWCFCLFKSAFLGQYLEVVQGELAYTDEIYVVHWGRGFMNLSATFFQNWWEMMKVLCLASQLPEFWLTSEWSWHWNGGTETAPKTSCRISYCFVLANSVLCFSPLFPIALMKSYIHKLGKFAMPMGCNYIFDVCSLFFLLFFFLVLYLLLGYISFYKNSHSWAFVSRICCH